MLSGTPLPIRQDRLPVYKEVKIYNAKRPALTAQGREYEQDMVTVGNLLNSGNRTEGFSQARILL